MSANIFTFNDRTQNWLVYAANIASTTGNLYIGNSVVVSGNITANNFVGNLSGNVTTSNITGFAGQSSLVRISGNLIIPSGISSTGIGAGQLRYNTTLLAIQFYNGSIWVTI